MIANLVSVHVLPDCVDAFIEITAYNHNNTRKEAGNVRFDILQNREDPTRFTMVEVFRDEEAVAFHKTTDHYKKWRETVAPYMAEPRSAVSHTTVCFD